MSSESVAVVEIGYERFVVPIEQLPQLVSMFGMRRVERKYESNGYVYWYAKQSERPLEVSIINANSILDSEPSAQVPPPAPVAVSTPDVRVLAAPSDTPIEIKNVPSMREFVDEFRHEDF